MNRFRLMITAIVVSISAFLWTMDLRQSSGAESLTRVRLREMAAGHPLMGTAVMSSQLDDPKVADFLAREFDCITPENQLKPMETEPRPGEFAFAEGDKILAFTRTHHMKLIGHNLCWHSQSPDWMYKDASGKPLSRDMALKNLKRHIDGVAGHYKGKVLGWDVVNEALSDSPGEYLRHSSAKQAIGDDFIVQAFKFAHEADPNAELYYNDYSNENPAKRASQIRLIRELKAAGCRLDAVGIQGHFMIQYAGTPAVLEDAIKAFAAEGVKVCISELDVDMLPRKTTGANVSDLENADPGTDPYQKGMPVDVAQKQADFYGQLFDVIGRHKDVVERVTFWGVDDGASWLNSWPVKGRTNHPLLFSRDMQPKLAFYSVEKALGH